MQLRIAIMHLSARRHVLVLFLLTLTTLAQQPQQQQTTGNNAPDPAMPTLGSSSSAQSSASSSGKSSSSSSADDSNNTGFPTLTSVSTSSPGPGFPTHSALVPPKLVVPDTSQAPYMHNSTLPEGTVFISVGAVLAILGAAVIAWRLAVAYSLRRSLSRVANSAYAADGKSLFPFSDSKGQYSSVDPGSVSLEHLSAVDTSYGNGGVRDRTSKGKRESGKAPPSSSLFFSPTGAGMNAPNKSASSSHLPSGYYAQGGSTINSGDLFAQLGGQHSRDGSVEAGNTDASRPQSYNTSGRPSRPYSEQRRSRLGNETSAGTATASSHGRAPSAYLEGLMDSQQRGQR